MAGHANITRRSALAMLSGAAISAALAASVPASAAANDIEEITSAWAVISPLERKFLYDQLYASHRGEPNVIDRTADYTFEEWAKDIRPWERDMIAEAFKSPNIHNY